MSPKLIQDLITVKFTPIADRDHKTATIVKHVHVFPVKAKPSNVITTCVHVYVAVCVMCTHVCMCSVHVFSVKKK